MIGKALARALRDFFSPKILLLVLLPPLGSSLFWITVIWWNWGVLTSTLLGYFNRAEFLKPLTRWLPNLLGAEASSLVSVIAFILLFVFVFPLVLVTSVSLTSVLANPVVFSQVLKKRYPYLRQYQASFLGSLWNTTVAVIAFLILWFLSLPLWLIPGGAIAVPLFLSAYLNKKIYTYDTLAEMMPREKHKAFELEMNSSFWLASLICAGLNFVPMAIFISPVLAALLFIHLAAGKKAETNNSTGNTSESK